MEERVSKFIKVVNGLKEGTLKDHSGKHIDKLSAEQLEWLSVIGSIALQQPALLITGYISDHFTSINDSESLKNISAIRQYIHAIDQAYRKQTWDPNE